jgi:nucleotide-binding universal stress UspA family protein
MPIIIAATDFSDVSENALHYACRLAMPLQAQIVVLHSYVIPVMFSDIPIPNPANDTGRIAQESMDALLGRFQEEYSSIGLSGKVLYGDIIGGVNELVGDGPSPFLVVVGNNYDADNQVWSDSNLFQTFKHMQYPVLAIPKNCVYKPIAKIGFAYDNVYEGSDIALLLLREMCAALSTELHVINGVKDAISMDNEPSLNSEATTVLQSAGPHYHFVHNEDIDTAIVHWASTNQIDWLAILPRKHSFFESLFHKSHTKILVNHANIPLLALHENKS